MLLIDAVYIHESGGKNLLIYLATSLTNAGKHFQLLLDKRLESKIPESFSNTNYILIQGSESERKKFYKNLPSNVSSIFCFANVPPPLLIRNKRVIIYFQNVLLVSVMNEKNGYSLVAKIKFKLKSFYIKKLALPNYEWIVQTQSMKSRISNYLDIKPEIISLFPFFDIDQLELVKSVKNEFSFIYVADGVPQKNHKNLLAAWDLLYVEYGLSPILHLTIPNTFESICKEIVRLNEKGLRIVNHGILSRKDLNVLYSKTEFLIFPSYAESFGLPLIEAINGGCEIICSNLNYVFDVVTPSMTFNPFDKISIAHSVIQVHSKKKLVPSKVKINNMINELIEDLFLEDSGSFSQ